VLDDVTTGEMMTSCFVFQTKAMIDKLQDLVSTDGRFKNMREALRW
jgi:hypothetical protein